MRNRPRVSVGGATYGALIRSTRPPTPQTPRLRDSSRRPRRAQNLPGTGTSINSIRQRCLRAALGLNSSTGCRTMCIINELRIPHSTDKAQSVSGSEGKSCWQESQAYHIIVRSWRTSSFHAAARFKPRNSLVSLEHRSTFSGLTKSTATLIQSALLETYTTIAMRVSRKVHVQPSMHVPDAHTLLE